MIWNFLLLRNIRMKNTLKHSLFLLPSLLLFLISCSKTPLETPKNPHRVVSSFIEESGYGPNNFPEISTDNGELKMALNVALKKSAKGMTPQDYIETSERLRHYLMFLGLSARDFKKAESALSSVVPETDVALRPLKIKKKSNLEETAEEEDADKTPSNIKAIQRLLIASTQFLECQDLTDWECLEKTPRLRPRADFRVEAKPGLGVPILAGNSLDMDVFFTQAWDGSRRATLVDHFAEKLEKDVGRSLSIAMYGINDIKGSMARVYNAISAHAKNPFVKVRAVVDVSGFEKTQPGQSPWVFDYVRPNEQSPNYPYWLFGNSSTTPGGMHATFQYDGTPDFIRELNEGIKDQEESRARIEWSTSHIMHNKFAVLENEYGNKAVWTGTANMSNHCMGAETNSNMSVYIRNNYIAQAFLDEFNHMFNFNPRLVIKSKFVVSSDPRNPTQVGHFHRNKSPISQRFFNFKDGTKLRVHFAPTGDAEHRVILPMLLSAKEGDEIRISMFGGTGFEIVRAMQYAAAKGANVRIVFDLALGHGLTSWTRDEILNVFMKNPYLGKIKSPPAKAGNIFVKVSTWAGKNHYKAGTLSRRLPSGAMLAEQIILGSQNWSSGGNDKNDENLISIQNLKRDVVAAKMFNQEFDNHLWVKSRNERPRFE